MIRESGFRDFLKTLSAHEVEFVVIGGVAAIFHGAVRTTQDTDIVYLRTPENMRNLAAALHGFRPTLRGAPPGLPFRFDAETIAAGLNFTLDTERGWIDLLGEVTGGGAYEELLPHAVGFELEGIAFKAVDLPFLIHLKRTAGRPKDFEAIAELEILLAQRDAGEASDGMD